jgi:hypothetical protein
MSIVIMIILNLESKILLELFSCLIFIKIQIKFVIYFKRYSYLLKLTLLKNSLKLKICFLYLISFHNISELIISIYQIIKFIF